jgi:hypothetical protein
VALPHINGLSSGYQPSGTPVLLRTSRSTVTFARPFLLGGTDEVFPQGDYDVETDEELVEGLSFLAYRRVATYVRLHPETGGARTLTVDPVEFDAAVARDLASGQAEEQARPE